MKLLYAFTCLLCTSLYAHDGWDDEPSYRRGYAENVSDESWSPDIPEATDTREWHTINRWQGSMERDQDRVPLSPDLNPD